jgi:hypothetical protein
MKLIGTGVLENISTRNDGSIKIVIATQEMGSDDAGRLFTLRNTYLKFLLSDDNISKLEEGLIEAERLHDERKIKSPSQKLRSVLFLFHKQSGNRTDFQQWYESEMTKIIESYKDQLNSSDL